MAIIAMTTFTGATRSIRPGWSSAVADDDPECDHHRLALGWAAIGVLGGGVVDAVGLVALYLTGACCVLLSAGLLVAFLRSRRTSAGLPTELAAPAAE
ncbi:MAG: hypothetical protein IPK16_30685 [Anaerolineales bacterium]|nr:hypothetical protein [Anaerolineales bacterium]